MNDFDAPGSPKEPEPFDLCGKLPRGMTLLQASAGTGKTFTIAALTTRYVAEAALPIDRLLVITFTRMATGELRERVRDRLVLAFDGLVDILEGTGTHEDDEIVRHLADAPRPEVEARRDRLGKAIADFDAATIETTHGFCLQVLYGLGTAGDVDREVTLVEDVQDVREEVVDDLYLRKFAGQPNPLGFTRAQAGEIARHVLNHPDALVVPPWSEAEDPPSIRRRFADAVRSEMERRKRVQKVLTYDDVLLRLRQTLLDEQRGGVARARLRERYDVVLVDEFQDTDPVQWEIMHSAFGRGGTTLVLIGDPKQAIYAFRGADVQAYLQAREVVASEWTLDVNWRSDEGLLQAYDALFARAELGDAGITYRNIAAAEANRATRLVGLSNPAPLQIRLLHAGDGLVPLTKTKGQPQTGDARALIARDLASEVVGLLSAAPEVVVRRRDGGEVRRSTLHPGHIAVLVRVNSHAVIVRDALQAAGVPAVIGGSVSVFATGPAREWLRLLEALERPTARDRASLAALTCFIGWTPEQVATASEEQWEDLHWSLHRWAALLRDEGIASLYETVSASHDVPARVLAGTAGERFMTDLRHIGQLLHEAGVSEGLGPTAMATWLGRRIHDADKDTDNEERARRLESDAAAVQVITIHRSKGLEFPVVLCPYMWDGRPQKNEVPVFHDPHNGFRRTIDVGQDGKGFPVHQKMELEEGRGEDLRLLYVALTRAQHRAVLWWAGVQDSEHSPLSRLLFDRDAHGVVNAYGGGRHTDDEVEAAFVGLSPLVGVERVGLPAGGRWHRDAGRPPDLEPAVFDRLLDVGWRRVSYSGITRALHDVPVIGSEPELELTSDEEAPATTHRGTEIDDRHSTALHLGAMPGGALVGTVVHGVLERSDFAAPDLGAEITDALAKELAWHHVDLGDTDAVVTGLCTAIESPLGALVGGFRLRQLARRDRLDELGFEIPLVGGGVPTGRLDVAHVADLLQAELPTDDPVARYAPALRNPALNGVLRGYLTGSLDLVLRLHDGRYVVADYKTNKLGAPGEALTAWHYRSEALEEEMAAAHYPLQALLYSVALHRYLRWRLPGYRAERHFGGVLYLFVRGMSTVEPVGGDESPPGVWSWLPPAGVIESLSDLFDRGRGAVIAGEAQDRFDAALALGAEGLLREFNRAGVLSTSDVHVAVTLARLGGATDEVVRLGAALAARAPRLGHVCVDLAAIASTASTEADTQADLGALPWPEPVPWLERMAASSLVGDDLPLHLVGSNLYLDRLWSDEVLVASDLSARAARPWEGVDEQALAMGLAVLFPTEDEADLQRVAAVAAVRRRFSVIAGGPGTGKTTTVARALALLLGQAEAAGARPPLIALAAPTGKAAARLEEAVHGEALAMAVDPAVAESLLTLDGSTLHRLLGFSPGNRTRFRHNRLHHLPHDVVVVDETSMVSLSMMARVVEAVRPDARLILVGDPEQLASVEAGAVLGDIVGPASTGATTPGDGAATSALGKGIVVLRRVHRFGRAIADVAQAIQRGDADQVMDVLAAGDSNVEWIAVDDARASADRLATVRALAVASGRTVIEAARAGRAEDAIAALSGFRLLCAHRQGPDGVATWTSIVENWLRAEVEGFVTGRDWYVGRPLIVTENDYGLQLYNGDTGVVMEGADGRLAAAFERGGAIAHVSPTRLAAVDSVYAMTVHKSQGSQFGTVAFLLPGLDSRVLTRELLYTAVTRARERLVLVGPEGSIRAAIERPITRASGLRQALWRERG